MGNPRSTRISIRVRHYKKTARTTDHKVWLVGIPVLDELGRVVDRKRVTYSYELTRQQVADLARKQLVAWQRENSRPERQVRLIQTLLDYFDQITHGPQPKAHRTALIDWTAIRLVYLWRIDQGGEPSPFSALGPVHEHERIIRERAVGWDLSAADFGPEQAQSLQHYLARRLNATSTNLYLRHLSAMLSWAVKLERWPRNPIAGLSKLDPGKGTAGGQARTAPSALTGEARRRLIESGPDDLPLFLQLLAWSAMRASSAVRLTPGCVDLERGVLTVPATKQSPEYRVPVIAPLRPVLAAWGGVWQHRQDWYSKMARTRADALGIAIRQPLHGLRHGFATSALAAGVPIQWVSKYMGHSSLEVTSRSYDHSDLVGTPIEPEFRDLATALREQEAGRDET